MRPISNDQEYREAMARIEDLMDAPEGSAQAKELDQLADIVEAYESIHFPVAPVSPAELAQFRKEQMA